MILSIAKVLQKEGFIADINEEGEGYESKIVLGLKQRGKTDFLRLDQCDKQAWSRVYKNTKGLPKVLELELLYINLQGCNE